MEARINSSLLVPPSDCLGNMLRVSAEVTIEFVAEIRFRRGGKCWQIVENVVSGRRTLKKRSFSIEWIKYCIWREEEDCLSVLQHP